MTDETRVDARVRAGFATQAEWCTAMGAPFLARICTILSEKLDRTTATGRRVLDWPTAPLVDALPLRLTGGLQALVRRGRLPALAAHWPPNVAGDDLDEALIAAITDADAELLPWLDGPPQTNEVGRSGVLMAGLLVIAAETGLPLALFELGASAGLNLRLDAYAYDLGGRVIDTAGAPITLTPRWTGNPPAAATVTVANRRGVDLNPLDVTDSATVERLLAYVWAEQNERVERLTAALAATAGDPPAIDREDAAGWVERRVAPTPGVATVVMHSIAFQYFPAESRDRITAHMAARGAKATAEAPLAWLRYELEPEAGAATLRLTLWPGGEDRRLAKAHPHGTWIEWLA
ncbi:DUF2332 domain-containing protein [Sphingoaurantiacus capsulatus]|uniref:DUF2332 domain-containing protein n=1 Tax=Sphingoaurantiacus capsulatus TaxID=1771310 RepID=A0ABV7XDQ7_9SPHN